MDSLHLNIAALLNFPGKIKIDRAIGNNPHRTRLLWRATDLREEVRDLVLGIWRQRG